ncbi:outer membrane beta-barrel protein [Lujinxingia litoralis]|nr:outer membrane beta-barrel protein [Lujinxingia litoralis]
MKTRMTLAFLTLAMTTLTLAAPATAQTTPFGTELSEPARLKSAFRAGRWNAGIDSSFARTSATNELPSGQEASDSTLFLRLDASVGVMVVKRLEVGANIGLLARRLNRDEAAAATETALTVQPMARYHMPMTDRFSTHVQLSLGPYFGGSSREVTVLEGTSAREVEERTSTLGFMLSTGLGVGYRVSEGLQIRFGVDMTWLWGRESIATLDESLSVKTTHLGTSAGLRYFF